MAQIKAVILDIDETLSPDISWLTLTRELGASPEAHLQLYTDYKNGIIGYERARDELLSLWRSTGNANRKFFQKIFEKIPLNEAAPEVVGDLKKRYRVCLITGSMDLYAQTVARKLEVGEWYANTKLFWGRAGELVGMEYDLNQSSKKLAQLKDYCKKHSLRLSQCVVVGDGLNDTEMFSATGRGVLVGADQQAELQAAAWKNIDSIKSLPAVLNGTDGAN